MLSFFLPFLWVHLCVEIALIAQLGGSCRHDVRVMFANIALVKAIMPGWRGMWDVK